MSSHPETNFLHERNPQFHLSTEVELTANYLRANGDRIPNEPQSKISAYLGFLANERYVNDGILTGDADSIQRQINAHCDDIHQSSSLRFWAEHLSDADYPDWFKFYTYTSVLKMGKFDQQNDRFQQRSSLTTTPYPELNRNALSQVYAWVEKSRFGEEARDEQRDVVLTKSGAAKLDFSVENVFDTPKKERSFQKALQSGNFAKLYVHAKHKTKEGLVTAEQREVIDGSWKKYAHHSDPTKLFDDLHGFGIDWCTISGVETAASHIRGGDFYVYYTRDNETNKEVVPRIAVRIEHGQVDEVRGIGPKQELEPALAGVVKEGLQHLPGGDKYIQRADDMERLNRIDQLVTNDPEVILSKKEVELLYELDHPIYGFGMYRDAEGDELPHPRVQEIRASRGNRDYPELKVLTIEQLRENFETSYTGYVTIAAQLDTVPVIAREEVQSLFDAKLTEWQQKGVLDYITERLITHNERYTPVFRPNAIAPVNTLKAIAINFAQTHANGKPTIDDQLYDAYTSDHEIIQFSGYRPDQGDICMSLISQKGSEDLGDTAEEQLTALAVLQKTHPQLNLRVPSLLDAVTLWNTAVARGEIVTSEEVEELSLDQAYFIRHFDLPVKVGLFGEAHPTSQIEFGQPSLWTIEPDEAYPARLSLG